MLKLLKFLIGFVFIAIFLILVLGILHNQSDFLVFLLQKGHFALIIPSLFLAYLLLFLVKKILSH